MVSFFPAFCCRADSPLIYMSLLYQLLGTGCCGECLLLILMYLSPDSTRQAINIPVTGRFPFLQCTIVPISQYMHKKLYGEGHVQMTHSLGVPTGQIHQCSEQQFDMKLCKNQTLVWGNVNPSHCWELLSCVMCKKTSVSHLEMWRLSYTGCKIALTVTLCYSWAVICHCPDTESASDSADTGGII